MSKSNMLLGNAKGKFGDIVFYRAGGEQRHRPLVTPKNPRTPAQMTQRVKIANVSALYRALAPILSDSFTNRPTSQSGYNAFASAAIPLSPYQTKGMASIDVVLPQACQLSKGTLQSLPAKAVDIDGDKGFAIPLRGEFTEASTIGAISSALLEQYPTLQVGDKILGLVLRFTESAEAVNGESRYFANLYTASIVIDPTSTDALDASEFMFIGGQLAYDKVSDQFDAFNQMAAYIVCRTDENGSLQCSTEWAELSQIAQSVYDRYRSENALSDAIRSYSVGTQSALR